MIAATMKREAPVMGQKEERTLDKAVMACEQRVELVDASIIRVGEYQRDIRSKQISNIINRFNPVKLGVLVVNRRKDGAMYVIDGQHRLTALRHMGIKAANCVIMNGLTPEEEADFYRHQNDDQHRLTTYDLFRAGICANDPHFVTIHYLLNKYGLKPAKRSGLNSITSLGALSRITRIYGFEVLAQTLEYITATWPRDIAILRREMMAGVAEFASRYRDQVTTEAFVSRMTGKLPGDMLYEYRRRCEGRMSGRSAFNPSMRYTLCSILVESYNGKTPKTSPKFLTLKWDNPAVHENGMDEI